MYLINITSLNMYSYLITLRLGFYRQNLPHLIIFTHYPNDWLVCLSKTCKRVNHNNTCRCAQVWMMSLIRIFNFRLTLILYLLYQMCQIRITIISQLVCQKHVKGLIHGWHHNNMQVCYSLKDVINQNTPLQTSD